MWLVAYTRGSLVNVLQGAETVYGPFGVRLRAGPNGESKKRCGRASSVLLCALGLSWRCR